MRQCSVFVVALLACGAAAGPVERSALSLVSPKFNYKTVLKEHARYSVDTDQRRFPHEVLAYVTPWNNHGYDVAKIFGSKFAWVAPVWLQLRSDTAGVASVTGTHDIDKAWMADVRKACLRAPLTAVASASDPAELAVPRNVAAPAASGKFGPFGPSAWPTTRQLRPRCPRIVPRVVWEAPKLSQQEMDRAVDVVAETVQRHGFDGVVMEMPVLDATADWIGRLANTLHRRTGPAGSPLALLLVLRPSTPPELVGRLARLGVDRFSLNTYDFSSGMGSAGPNAPLRWVRQTVRAMAAALEEAVGGGADKEEDEVVEVGDDGESVSADDDTAASTTKQQARRQRRRAKAGRKLLVGMAMYGHSDGSPSGGVEPVTAEGYLDLLRRHRPRMLLDRGAGEHLFRYTVAVEDGDQQQERRVKRRKASCYYPTLWSVAQRLRLLASEGVGVALWEVGQGLDYFYDLL